MTTALPDVLRWADSARVARSLAGLTAQELPTSVILAIVHVESAGDPSARRPRSQYHGLTQVGWAAAVDADLVRQPEGLSGTALADWRRDAAAPALHPDTALAALCKIVARYKSRTLYDGVTPIEGVAILWKGGAGTARRVQGSVRAGTRLEQAMLAEEAKIPSLREYVRRARAAQIAYSAALASEDEGDDDVCTCS